VPFDDGYTFGPVVVKPTSRGMVTLRSPVPHARPRILNNYLQTEQDRQSMIAGARLNMEISAAPALREWRREDFLAPASDSEADIIDFVQRRAHTVYHPGVRPGSRVVRGRPAGRVSPRSSTASPPACGPGRRSSTTPCAASAADPPLTER
jgi:choline dehydrogenase-like flavoprotein